MEKETQKKASAATATQSSPAIWMKIFRVQKGLKGFVQKEDSAKQKDSGDPAYRYVPGYEINKEFHRLLDENVLMCECSDVYSQNQIVDSWVNKLINGNVVPVTKREMLFTVYKDFWFRDPETGDRTPAVRSMGVGMNGFDKSAATANSVAERYFILKYFHVPCADSASEIDAHDDSYVPGLEKFRNAPSGEAVDDLGILDQIYAANEESCARSAAVWSESQKAWKSRREDLEKYLAHLLDRCGADRIVGNAGDTSLERTRRTVLDVNDAGMVALYDEEIRSLVAALPPYYSVKITVNKTKLAAFLKNDPAIQIAHPELLSTRENETVKFRKL